MKIKTQRVEIRVRGQINRDWSEYFGGLAVNHASQGETVLSGSFRDQAELQGMLSRLTDLGLELISVITKNRKALFSRKGGDLQTRKLNKPHPEGKIKIKGEK